MTQQERLMQLLTDCEGLPVAEKAEFLIGAGVVVLPCNFGDTLYRIRRFKRGKNWTKEAAHILTTTLTMNNVAKILFGGVMGKTVFLTREEAEAALKGGEGDG